jgi:N-acyl homoserine lactone hydrolase
MATTIRAVKTGTIRIRPSHRATDMSKPRWRRRLAIILDRDWTQPLPIYTYLIEHDEGLLLLDCGESARSTKPGWFPWWNPFFSTAVDIHVEPDDEIGPRLRSLGIDPTKDLKSLVLSHLHHDHADGLGHFAGTDIVVSDENFIAARPRIAGSLLGAVPGQWPSWFAPRRVTLDGPPAQSFDRSYPTDRRRDGLRRPHPGSHGRPHVGGGPHPRGDLLPRWRRDLRRGAAQAAHRRRILREHWGVAEHLRPHRRFRPVRTDRAAARARSAR